MPDSAFASSVTVKESSPPSVPLAFAAVAVCVSLRSKSLNAMVPVSLRVGILPPKSSVVAPETSVPFASMLGPSLRPVTVTVTRSVTVPP